jgi:hypothetical protein
MHSFLSFSIILQLHSHDFVTARTGRTAMWQRLVHGFAVVLESALIGAWLMNIETCSRLRGLEQEEHAGRESRHRQRRTWRDSPTAQTGGETPATSTRTLSGRGGVSRLHRGRRLRFAKCVEHSMFMDGKPKGIAIGGDAELIILRLT